MPLNPTESYEELSKYHQFYCSFHSAYELSEQNFLKVPPKTIIVSTYHDNSIESYNQQKIFTELIDVKNYLTKCLLTDNDDIPEHHKFHNKTIYMPGSCIPNIAVEFINYNPENLMVLGVFDINNTYNNDNFDDITTENQMEFNKHKFMNSSILPLNMVSRRDLCLKDLMDIIISHNHYNYGYIIFIDGCSTINFGDTYLSKSNISTKDLSKIRKANVDTNILKLSSVYTKYNRKCILDSLKKFTAEFSFFDKSLIDFSDYPKHNFEVTEEYKTKYKKDLRDVNRYFSKLSDVEEEEKNIYYIPPSGESVGSLGPLSSHVSGSDKNKENLFDKYFQKEVTQILSPRKKPSRSETRKIQPLRRSSRIASSRKMYDGKRRRSSSRIKHIKSNKRSSRVKHIKSNKRSSRVITLKKSTRSEKKYMARIDNKTVHFGASGYLSYETHKDKSRMHRYENRHRSRENWNKSGIKTAGFWSKWILWNKPSLLWSIKDTERRFGIKIRYKRK